MKIRAMNHFIKYLPITYVPIKGLGMTTKNK